MRFSFLPLILILLIIGCSSKVPVKIEPTMMSSSVDFTSPATIAGNSSPVYVLPVINSGWEKAVVDPRTGAWKSGRYVASVVEEGYWTTQEEAERSGKPFMVMGKGGPLVGGNIKEMGRSNTGGDELNIADLNNRMEKLEQGGATSNSGSIDPDISAQTAARLNALANQTQPIKGRGDMMMDSNHGSYEPQLEVPSGKKGSAGAGNPADVDVQIPYNNSTRPISYQVPIGNKKENLTVEFIDSTTAKIIFNGGEQQIVHLKKPNDKLVIRVKSNSDG